MKHAKFITLFLVIALILAVTIAPLLVAQAQLGLTAYDAHGGISLFTIEVGASAPPIAIACGGCSGGGSGPE